MYNIITHKINIMSHIYNYFFICLFLTERTAQLYSFLIQWQAKWDSSSCIQDSVSSLVYAWPSLILFVPIHVQQRICTHRPTTQPWNSNTSHHSRRWVHGSFPTEVTAKSFISGATGPTPGPPRCGTQGRYSKRWNNRDLL